MDSAEAATRSGEIWKALAEQIAAAIPDIVIGDDPFKAIRWAACAEACLWKATGECDTHDVRDVLAPTFQERTLNEPTPPTG